MTWYFRYLLKCYPILRGSLFFCLFIFLPRCILHICYYILECIIFIYIQNGIASLNEIHFVDKFIMGHFLSFLKILMDHQNLSEHVLCMVLYLIELGLENSAEEESDEEVSSVLL